MSSGIEVFSLWANEKKASEEFVTAKVDLETHRAVAELAFKKHIFSLARVREEQQDELKAKMATTSRREAT